ncbi:MAG: hypothetical protein AB7S52_04255 [Sphaerochaetaceae bacterium]
MSSIDWHVSYGFSPRQHIDARKVHVEELLASHAVGHAFMHHLEGLWYDPLSGNKSLMDTFGSDIPTDTGTIFTPVCTVNPWEGEARCMRILEDAWHAGARYWRLYPQEQGWPITHPVATLIFKWLRTHGCCLLIETTPENVERILVVTGEWLPIVGSFHFYDVADWSLRFRRVPPVFITTRFLHGPGIIESIADQFSDRLLFASDAPFGSIQAGLNLLPDRVEQTSWLQILEENSLRLIRSIADGD